MGVEEKIVAILVETKRTVATAESCTGGLVSAGLVDVPGVSAVFKEGYITYSNEAKERLLGVAAETLERYGAVSEQTAAQMALGAARMAGADCAVATTGIAGPDGGTPQKPVGLVYIGCCVGTEIRVRRCLFQGSRRQIRECAAQASGEILLEMLLEQ